LHYYGTRLSENISRREPEGYLLCLNVPVARTGTQEYLPEELGLSPPYTFGAEGVGDVACGARAGTPAAVRVRNLAKAPLISVHRPPAEVFSPETIASFEGMPVTNDHPPDGVDIGNIRALQKGHAHNVRRGSGEESDLLLADLIITDPVLIDLILEGKREISCGYTYELCEENGEYIQRKIRGNHVAVVDAGRAGKRVAIRDHKGTGLPATTKALLEPSPLVSIKNQKPERRTRIMKKSLSKILARMAKDGDIETVAEIIEEMIDPESAETPEEVVEQVTEEVAPALEDPAAVVETPEATIVVDESTLEDIVSRLDKIIELLTPAAVDDDPVEEIAEAVEEALEAVAAAAEEDEPAMDEDLGETLDPEEIAEIVEEILEPVPSEAISEILDPLEDECGEEEQEVLSTGDTLRTALTAVRPMLLKMPKKQRAEVGMDIAARLRKPAGRRGADAYAYADMKSHAAKRKPPRKNAAELGKRIMASRNINCRK